MTFPQETVILARKTTQDIPADPDSPLWSSAKPVEIPLASQVMARPKNYQASVKAVTVRALHNGREIAFLLEWEDSTKDTKVTVHTFSDAVALQFPSEKAGGKPHFGMGHEDGFVNIWDWKASLEEPATEGAVYAMVDDFLAGLEAGNILSLPAKTPVQNLVAGGFGTLSPLEMKAQYVSGRGRWERGTWKVAFKRAQKTGEKYEAQFEEGGLVPVAFAVWDGSKGERGARKAVSVWYHVALETEEKLTAYLYPLMALIAVFGGELGVILAIRRRRKAVKASQP